MGNVSLRSMDVSKKRWPSHCPVCNESIDYDALLQWARALHSAQGDITKAKMVFPKAYEKIMEIYSGEWISGIIATLGGGVFVFLIGYTFHLLKHPEFYWFIFGSVCISGGFYIIRGIVRNHKILALDMEHTVFTDKLATLKYYLSCLEVDQFDAAMSCIACISDHDLRNIPSMAKLPVARSIPYFIDTAFTKESLSDYWNNIVRLNKERESIPFKSISLRALRWPVIVNFDEVTAIGLLRADAELTHMVDGYLSFNVVYAYVLKQTEGNWFIVGGNFMPVHWCDKRETRYDPKREVWETKKL